MENKKRSVWKICDAKAVSAVKMLLEKLLKLSRMQVADDVKQGRNPDITTTQLPTALREAYKSGDADVVAQAEQAIHDYIAEETDLKRLLLAYDSCMDLRRKFKDKEPAEYKAWDFIAKANKEALRAKGFPATVMGSASERAKLARETTDTAVLDVLSGSLLINKARDVVRAVINNPNTSDEALRWLSRVSPLDYEAEVKLKERQK